MGLPLLTDTIVNFLLCFFCFNLVLLQHSLIWNMAYVSHVVSTVVMANAFLSPDKQEVFIGHSEHNMENCTI